MILPHTFDFLYKHRYFSAFGSQNKENEFVIVFERKTILGGIPARGKIVIPKAHAESKRISWFFSTHCDTICNANDSLDITEAWFKEVVLAISDAYRIYLKIKKDEKNHANP